VGVYDANRGVRTKKYAGHGAVVNSCHVSRAGDPLAVSGSDDNMAMVWDLRARRSVQQFESEYAILAVSFSGNDEVVFTSGIDNVVRAWDRRRESVVYTLEGHTDTVTGMSLSPDGESLLTNSMDRSLICWDVRNFVTTSRLSKQFEGHQV
jgi:Prp8 binding protein